MFSQSVISSTAVSWKTRGPVGISSGIQEPIFDLNDPNGNAVWLATSGGLWYCQDITISNPNWILKDPKVGTFSIVQHPINTNEFYASNDGGGTFWSNNNGITWSILGTTNSSGRLVTNDLGDLFMNISYGSTQRILRYDRNNGDFNLFFDLALHFPSEANQRITDIDFDHENLIYLSLSNGKILKSQTPFGGPWTNIMTGSFTGRQDFTGLAISKNSDGAKLLYSININTLNNRTDNLNWVRQSIDGGINWTDQAFPLNNDGTRFSSSGFEVDLKYKPGSSSDIILSGGTQVLVSTNGGSSWKSVIQKSKTNITFSKQFDLILDSYSSLGFLPNPFNSYNSTIADKSSNLITPKIDNLSFPDPTNKNKFTINGIVFSGDSILTRSSQFWPGNVVTSDKNEPDLNIFLNEKIGRPDTLFLFNRNGQLINKIKLDSEITHNFGYDSNNNSLYSIVDASSYGSYTIIKKVSKMEDEQWLINQYYIPQYIHPQTKLLPTNDSTLIIYGLNLYGPVYKVVLKENTASEVKKILDFNSSPEKFIASKVDQKSLITNVGSRLYFTHDEGETWSERRANDLMYDFAVNPLNFNHGFYCSNRFIYFTSNLLDPIPSWQVISTPELEEKGPFYKIWFRESDGELFVESSFNGIFSTNYFEFLNSDQIRVSDALLPDSLCQNEKVVIPFERIGDLGSNFTLEMEPEENSSSSSIFVETSSLSPVKVNLPKGIHSGKYTFTLISGQVSSNKTKPIYIAPADSTFEEGFPKIINTTQNSAVIKIKTDKDIQAIYIIKPAGADSPDYKDFKNVRDSIFSNIHGVISTKKDSVHSILVTGLYPGSSYNIYFSTFDPSCKCFGLVVRKNITTQGFLQSICTPNYYYPCEENSTIASLSICGPGLGKCVDLKAFHGTCNGYSFLDNSIPTILSGQQYSLNLKVGYLPHLEAAMGVNIWIDINGNNSFNDEFLFYSGRLNNWDSQISFTVPEGATPGLKRVRIKMVEGSYYSYNLGYCGNSFYGESMDFFINLQTNKNDLSVNLSDTLLHPCKSLEALLHVNGAFNESNKFHIELSNHLGEFSSPYTIYEGKINSDFLNLKLPIDMQDGFGYKIRLKSTEPELVSLPSPAFIIKKEVYAAIPNTSEGQLEIVTKNVINSNSSHEGTSKVEYDAWNSILLEPNFYSTSLSGGTFKAVISGCEN